MVLVALAINHLDAKRGAAFTLEWDEAQQAGLNQARFDAAMRWLIQYGFIERDEETEKRLRNVTGLSQYDYGLAFKVTERGRKALREAEARLDDPS
jgi:hypothetical protein